MADLAALDIKIGVDLTQLQKGLNSAGVLVDNFAKDLGTIGATSAAASGGMQAVSKSAEQMAVAFKSVQATDLPSEIEKTSISAKALNQQFQAFGKLAPFKNAGADLTKFTAGLTKTAPQLNNAAKASQTATLALGNLGRVAQDLPFGFIGIANNLNPLLESFQRLSVASKAAGTSLRTTLLSALTGPAGIGLALSVVSAALTFAQLGLGAWTRGFETAKKSTDDFKDTIASMGASLNTELTSMSSLIAVAKDYSASQETRQNAIDELQKRYPGYLSNLNLENINSQETARAIEKLTGALERKALVQAYSNLLTKAQEELIKNQNTNLEDQIGFFEKIGAVLKGSGNVSIAVTKGVSTALENQAASTKVLQDAVDSYSKKLSELTAQQAEGDDFELVDPTKAKKTAKDVETISDVLSKLKLELKALDVKELNEGLNLSNEKINKIEDAVTRLIVNFKVASDDTLISKLFGDINDIKFGPANFKDFMTKFEKSLPLEQAPKIPITFNFEATTRLSTIEAEIALEKMRAQLEAAGRKVFSSQGILSDVNLLNDDEVRKNFEVFNEQIQNTANLVAGTLGPAFDAVFAALEKGDSIFQALGQAIQKVVIDLAKAALKAAILAIIIKLITGGASSFGNIFSSLAGLPKFAEGGIVPPGFPNDSYPALLSSNEAVIPLDRMNQFIKPNNSQVVVLESIVRGQDLVLVQQRTERKNRRTY